MITELMKVKSEGLRSTAFNTFVLAFGVCVAYTMSACRSKSVMMHVSIVLVWVVFMGGSVGGVVIEYEAEQLTRLEYMGGESGYYKESIDEERIQQECDANNCLISGENDISWDMITGSKLNTIISGPSTVTGSIELSIRILNLTVSRGFVSEYVHPEVRLGTGFGNTIDGSSSYDQIKNEYSTQTQWYDAGGSLIENFALSKFSWDKTWKRISEYNTKNLNDIRECGSWTDNTLKFAAIHAVIPQFKGIAVGHFDEDDMNDGLFAVSLDGGPEQKVSYLDLVIGKQIGNGITLKLYVEPDLKGPVGRGCLFYNLNGPYVDFFHAGYCNPGNLGAPSTSGIGMVQTAYVPNIENLTPTTIFYGREIPNEVIWQRGSNPKEQGTMSYKEFYYIEGAKDPKIFGFLAAWTVKKIVKAGVMILVIGTAATTTALWADAKDEWCEAIMYSENVIESLVETVTPFNVTEGPKQFSMSKNSMLTNNQFSVVRGMYSNVRGTGVLKVMCDMCQLDIKEGVVDIIDLTVSDCMVYQTTGSGSCKISVSSIGSGGNIPLTSTAQLLESFIYVETGMTVKVLGVLVTSIASNEISICSGQMCDTATVRYELGSDGGHANELNPDSVKPQWLGDFNDLCSSNGWFCFTYSLLCIGSILASFLMVYSLYRLFRDRSKVRIKRGMDYKTLAMTIVYLFGILAKVGASESEVDLSDKENKQEVGVNQLLTMKEIYNILYKTAILISIFIIYNIDRILKRDFKANNGTRLAYKVVAITSIYSLVIIMGVGAAENKWAINDLKCGEPNLMSLVNNRKFELLRSGCILELGAVPKTDGILYGVTGMPFAFSDKECSLTPINDSLLKLCYLQADLSLSCSDERVSIGWCMYFGTVDLSACIVRNKTSPIEKIPGDSVDTSGSAVTTCGYINKDYIYYFETNLTSVGGCNGATKNSYFGVSQMAMWPSLTGGLYYSYGNRSYHQFFLKHTGTQFIRAELSYCYTESFAIAGLSSLALMDGDTTTLNNSRQVYVIDNYREGDSFNFAFKLPAPKGSVMLTQEKAYYYKDTDAKNLLKEAIIGLCTNEDGLRFICVKERKFNWGNVIEVSGYRRVKKDNINMFHIYSVVAVDGATGVEDEVCSLFKQLPLSGAIVSRLGRTWWTVTCIDPGVELCEYKVGNDNCGSESRVRMNVVGEKKDSFRDKSVEKSIKRAGRSGIISNFNLTDSIYYKGVIYALSIGGPICLECEGIDSTYGGRCNSSIGEAWVKSIPTMYENTLDGQSLKTISRVCIGLVLDGIKCEGKLTDKGGVITAASGCTILSQDGWKSFKLVKAGENANLKEGVVSYWYKGRLENDNVKSSDTRVCWGGMSVSECWTCLYYEYKTEFWVPVGLAIGFISVFLICFIWGALKANWIKRSLKNAKSGVNYIQEKMQKGMEWLSGKIGQTLKDTLEDIRKKCHGLRDKGKLSYTEVVLVEEADRYYNKVQEKIDTEKDGDVRRAKRNLATAVRKYMSAIISYGGSKAGRQMDAIVMDFKSKYGDTGELIKDELDEFEKEE
uniref:Putative glycoprotein n=1 Tax=Shahe bunya-like virus 2 TaxID=1923411 RepID=A0A1L3KPK5_9VIRU|nr:putative glycoprotein [Shahe bunya-like virus 2]